MTSMEGFVRSTEDLIPSLLWLVVVLLVIMFILALWNLFTNQNNLFASKIGNLFLKINIENPLRVAPADEQPESHLRSVGSNSATIITSGKLEKGQRIIIDVSSLPDFPEKNVELPAQVSSVSPVRGSNSFLTEIRFNRSEGPVIKSLMNYVRRLSQASGNW